MNNNVELEDYSFGQAYYGEVPEELISKYAALFGEGSKKLTKLLLFCWNNNIRTFTCCKGHEGKGPGYIGFLPDEELAKYLIEIVDQLMINEIKIDKYEGILRVTFYVRNELDFKSILNLIQKYVNAKKNEYQYNTRFSTTDNLINEVMSSGRNSEIRIKNGKSFVYEIERNKASLMEEKDYCPNSSITHILHSKITSELNQAFSKTSDYKQI